MTPTEPEMAAMLARAGITLNAEQLRALMPGAALLQSMLDRVNTDLPREAEPAALFRPEPG